MSLFYGDAANREKGFKFKAYKEEDVLTAMQEMFGVKCAYCESEYAATTPADVEHYRPKGGFEDDSGSIRKPGYYWLAAEWTNLLPSCPDCNRERGHDYEDETRITGKANRFPLADEAKRAEIPGEETHELPLLLDPTRDDPREHLEFGEEGIVRPALFGGAESARGRATIDVLGLLRPALSGTRRAHLVWIDGTIESFKRAIAELERNPASEFAREVLERELRDLKKLIDPKSPYTAMARERIVPVLEEAGVDVP